eukprot:1953121-Prymnesium_polylepis.1
MRRVVDGAVGRAADKVAEQRAKGRVERAAGAEQRPPLRVRAEHDRRQRVLLVRPVEEVGRVADRRPDPPLERLEHLRARDGGTREEQDARVGEARAHVLPPLLRRVLLRCDDELPRAQPGELLRARRHARERSRMEVVGRRKAQRSGPSEPRVGAWERRQGRQGPRRGPVSPGPWVPG